MNKFDKKIENNLVNTLTKVCKISLKEVPGFTWITHFLNYKRFPESLIVVCVFETNAELAAAKAADDIDFMRDLIHEHLGCADIKIGDAQQQIHFDTEEACAKEHSGNWQQRYRQQ